MEKLRLIVEKLDRIIAAENLLLKYMKENSINRSEFAEELGITANSLDRLCSSIRRPGLDLANKIEKLTKGKVPTTFWESVPKHSAD
jgi:transcriptional regulator with XRE-family HTH domain